MTSLLYTESLYDKSHQIEIIISKVFSFQLLSWIQFQHLQASVGELCEQSRQRAAACSSGKVCSKFTVNVLSTFYDFHEAYRVPFRDYYMS